MRSPPSSGCTAINPPASRRAVSMEPDRRVRISGFTITRSTTGQCHGAFLVQGGQIVQVIHVPSLHTHKAGLGRRQRLACSPLRARTTGARIKRVSSGICRMASTIWSTVCWRIPPRTWGNGECCARKAGAVSWISVTVPTVRAGCARMSSGQSKSQGRGRQ